MIEWIANWINVWAMRFGWWESPSLALDNSSPWDCRPIVLRAPGLVWDPGTPPRWPLSWLREWHYRRRGWRIALHSGSWLTLSLGITDAKTYTHPELPGMRFKSLADAGRAERARRSGGPPHAVQKR